MRWKTSGESLKTQRFKIELHVSRNAENLMRADSVLFHLSRVPFRSVSPQLPV